MKNNELAHFEDSCPRPLTELNEQDYALDFEEDDELDFEVLVD